MVLLIRFLVVLGLMYFSGATIPLFAQNIEVLDAQNGFYEVELGDSLHHFKNLKRDGSYLKKDKYVRIDDPLIYADIKLKAVNYLFYKGRLHSLHIKLEGEKNSHPFLDLLKMFYGDGEQNALAPHFTWQGKRVKLVYEENLFTKNADVFFISVEVERIFSQEWKITY